MNDAEEWVYALRLFKEVLEEYNGNFQGPYKLVEETPSFHDHFTFSFSEQKDLLSQWRGYCPQGGYSFCIDDELLEQMREEHKLVFERCIYDVEQQKEFIRDRIIGVRPEILAQQIKDEAERTASGRHSAYSIYRGIHDRSESMPPKFYLLCLLKHPSFKEECEWRMVGSFSSNSTLSKYMKLRTSRNMLIPYLELPLPIKLDEPDEYYPETPRHYRWKIKEVVVSPFPHQELAVAACKLVIPPYIMNHVGDVTPSAIPYVNW
jgi:hypothetical protein